MTKRGASKRDTLGGHSPSGATSGKAKPGRGSSTAATPVSRPSGPEAVRALRLRVDCPGRPGYWLEVECAADATLAELDALLRKTWLECCGHLSAFTVGEKRYVSAPDGDDEDMEVRLSSLLRRGTRIGYEYDFGSTTDLRLRVVSVVATEESGGPVRLVARNAPPRVPCASCGAESTKICAMCGGDPGAWFCGKCADKHHCEEPSFLPVVNSPRAGVCAYGT